METVNRHYGLGFFFRKEWKNLRFKAISGRITALEGSFKETKFKWVNRYGPTQMLANKRKDIYETFLQQLKTSIKTNNGQILIIHEDFNAKMADVFKKSNIKEFQQEDVKTIMIAF